MYYIDGYNLIFRLDYQHESLKEKREELINSLNEQLEAVSLEATLVFDSLNPEESRTSLSYLHIVFSSGSADEWILQAVKCSSRPRQCTVVTTDKALLCNIFACGAKALSVEAFLAMLQKKLSKKAPPEKPTESFNQMRYLKIFEERLKQ